MSSGCQSVSRSQNIATKKRIVFQRSFGQFVLLLRLFLGIVGLRCRCCFCHCCCSCCCHRSVGCHLRRCCGCHRVVCWFSLLIFLLEVGRNFGFISFENHRHFLDSFRRILTDGCERIFVCAEKKRRGEGVEKRKDG